MNRNKRPASGKTCAVCYGGERVGFRLVFSKRSSLSIAVHPDQQVIVRAPVGRSLAEIKERVRRRAAWILKQRDYFERFQPLATERQYVSGETHLYLGRQYRLKVINGNPETVRLKGRYLWVHTNNRDDRSKVTELVQRWYRDHAVVLLWRRLDSLMEAAGKVGIPYPSLKYRRMAKRWGSCAKSGTITLNTELVKAPIHCIDYVIAHELCHLRHKDHGPAFWRFLSRLVPDWEKRKRRLEEVLI